MSLSDTLKIPSGEVEKDNNISKPILVSGYTSDYTLWERLLQKFFWKADMQYMASDLLTQCFDCY